MPEKTYLYLLLLCGFWYQRIIGTFADEEIKKSSDFLVRQKRVVCHEPFKDRTALLENHPYIVHLKYHNRIYCVGVILSHFVIISTAECALYNVTEYKVISGSVRSNEAVAIHNVTRIQKNYGNHPNKRVDGIALFTIHPPIVYGRFSNKINLHKGLLLPGMIGTVSGWGFNYKNPAGRGTEFPKVLRSIEVPIISHRDCVNRYQHFYNISDMDICTFHPQRHCGHNDFGAPLVIDGLLVGIFLRSGPIADRYNGEFPDIFALLQHTDYIGWISANI